MPDYTVVVDLTILVDAETEEDAQMAAENLVIDHMSSIDREKIGSVHLDRSDAQEVAE